MPINVDRCIISQHIISYHVLQVKLTAKHLDSVVIEDSTFQVIFWKLSKTEGNYETTRSLWALRARLLVGGPSGRFRPFGPAFGPSGLLTHYPTANTLSNPWIVC